MPRRPRLFVEPLEDRRLLSAAPSPQAVAPLTTPAALSAPPDPTSLVDADLAPGTVTVYRHGAPFVTYEAADDTDLARGDALRLALAEAQAWDELMLDAATYDMGGLEHIEFPARVTVVGAGKEATKITSSVPQGVDGAATFTLNNLTTIEDCWLEGSLHDGQYQPLVGMQGTPAENVTTYLRRVKITGDSDGIFIWTNSLYSYTLYGYDCEISTNYDSIALLGSGQYAQTVKMYNSTITAAQPSAIPHHSSNAVNLRSGFVGLYDCTVNALGDADSLQTAGIWCYLEAIAEIENCTFNVTAPAGAAYDLLIEDDGAVTVVGGQGSGPGGTYTSFDGSEVYQAATPNYINGRRIFYNNSAFDDTNPRAGVLDADAIATDKFALLPGDGLATFTNVTSYSKGINGIRLYFTDVRSTLTVDDFTFKLGNDNSPAGWDDAPDPISVTMLGNSQVAGPHHVDLIWADGAITNTWLEVRVLPTAHTGLATADVFYFGSRVGDTGDSTPMAFSTTVAGDASAIVTGGLGPAAGITDVRDIDRSNVITIAGDRGAVLANIGAIFRIEIPLEDPPPPELNTPDESAIASALSSVAASSRAARRRRPVSQSTLTGDGMAPGAMPAAGAASHSDDTRSLSLRAATDSAADDPVDDELDTLLAALAAARHR